MQQPASIPFAFVSLAATAALLALYAYVALTSPGYDDEFGNMWQIEQLGWRLIGLAQRTDVHPPGAYAINLGLFEVLRDWSMVRLVSALATVAALLHAIATLARRHGPVAALVAYVSLGLSPALLMWCTGLRWYAYFVPLLIWLCVVPATPGWRYWLRPFAGSLVLGYLSYAAFVVAPALMLLYWRQDRRSSREKRRQVLPLTLLSALLYAPQMLAFVTTHFPNRGSQTFAWWRGLIGLAVSQLSNQGVFPLSPGAVLTALGTLGFVLLGLDAARRRRAGVDYLGQYALATLGLLASGLAGKIRNCVVLVPLQGFWFASVAAATPFVRWRNVSLLCLGLGNAIGVYNVATHRDTTKNSWNLPAAEVLEALDGVRASCATDPLILVHDPSLTWLIEERGLRTASAFTSYPKTAWDFERRYDCIVAFRTFGGGSLRAGRAQAMYDALDSIAYGNRQSLHFGRDRYFEWKRQLEPGYPEYAVELIVLRDATGHRGLEAWLPYSE